MSSFFRRLFGQPKTPPMQMPKPDVPAVPTAEGPEEIKKLLRKRRGRESTILTGSLEPVDIGKKTLLG